MFHLLVIQKKIKKTADAVEVWRRNPKNLRSRAKKIIYSYFLQKQNIQRSYRVVLKRLINLLQKYA